MMMEERRPRAPVTDLGARLAVIWALHAAQTHGAVNRRVQISRNCPTCEALRQALDEEEHRRDP